MAVETGYSKIVTSGSVFLYDTGDTFNSYIGEPTTNIWGIVNGSSVNNRAGWDMPYAYNGSITNTVYSSTWNGNRIWEVLHTLGTSGYGGYESWRLCVDQPTASPNTYSGTRRVAIKICVLEGSITDMALHTGGGNSSHNSSNWTPIPPSQVPSDCPQKSGWYQFLADASWNSTTVGHCVGLGFITFNRVRILTTEPMYYPSSYLIPFTGYTRSTTQAMIDIVGGNTIDLANMSYAANNAISFDGTDDYTTVPSYSPSSNTEMTIDIWTKPDSTSQQTTLMSKWGASGLGNFSWLLFLNWFAQGNLYFLVGNSSGNNYSITSMAHNLSTSAYTNFTITYNAGAINMYRNGVLITTASSPYTTLKSVTTPLTVGADFDAGSSDSLVRPYDGLIPIAKVYNRALTASEVLSNFNHYKTRFNIT